MPTTDHSTFLHQAQRLKILCAGIASLILMVGIARFAYTPMLPLMQHQAGLGIAHGGWLESFNYVVHFFVSFIVPYIVDLGYKDRDYLLVLL